VIPTDFYPADFDHSFSFAPHNLANLGEATIRVNRREW
jgi:hypothetical protein